MAKWSGQHIKCLITGRQGATLHHIYTQKARPDLIDKEWNQMPLCHELHVLVHKQGMIAFAERFPDVKKWLIKNGWEICPIRKKWQRNGT